MLPNNGAKLRYNAIVFQVKNQTKTNKIQSECD